MRSWEMYLKVKGWHSKYPSVDRFLRHYRRMLGSERTRVNCLKALTYFCQFTGLDPEQLIRLTPKKAGEKLQTFLDLKREEGKSIRYINALQAYLKVFFRVNGFKNGKEVEVEGYHQPARYRKRPEYIPTPEEIERMAYAAGSKRNKALILLAYTSGLRNATIRALRYKDVKEELEKGYEIIKIPVYPEMKKVDPEACKGGIPYYTFISKETVKALKEYLAERMSKYGGIEPEEPLFCSETTNLQPEIRRKTKIKRDTLEVVVKRAAKKAGIKDWQYVTPHCLRKAFESALRNSGIDINDREFLMGHILPGSQDAYYDRSKVENLRVKYSKVRFFPKTGEIDKLEMVKAFAKTLGIEGIEIKIAKLKEREPNLSEEDAIGRIVKEELIRSLGVETRKAKENSDPKKIICEDELEGYLAGGWDFVTVLPSGKILVRRAM